MKKTILLFVSLLLAVASVSASDKVTKTAKTKSVLGSDMNLTLAVSDNSVAPKTVETVYGLRDSEFNPVTDLEYEYTSGNDYVELTWVAPANPNPVVGLEEGFEGELFPPEGWSIADVDGDGENWFRGIAPNYPSHTGDGSAVSASWDGAALTPDNYLITPPIEIEAGMQLSWWVASQLSTVSNEHYTVYVGASSDPASFETVLFEETLPSGTNEYLNHIVTLDDYAGQTVYFAFRHHDVSDVYKIKFDDIVVNSAKRVADYNSNIARTRENVTGYDIYINDQMVETVTTTEYMASNLESGDYTFGVAAVYPEGTSDIVEVGPVAVNVVVEDTEAPEFVSLEGNTQVVGNDMNLTLVVSDQTGVPSTMEATYNLTGSEETLVMNLSKGEYTYTGTIPSPEEASSCDIVFHLMDTVDPANTADLVKQIDFVSNPIILDPVTDLEYDYTSGNNYVDLTWVAPGGNPNPNPVVGLEEGFEGDVFPPEGWTIADVDGDGDTWAQGTSANTTAHSGEGAAISASWAGSPLTPDNYLITPAIEIQSGMELSWWVAGQDPNWAQEHYAVYVGDSADPASFSTVLFEETIPANPSGTIEYLNHVVGLDDYAGQTVYFAFRHFDVTDMFRVNIDDVVVGSSKKVADYNSKLVSPVVASGETKATAVVSKLKKANNKPSVVTTPFASKDVTGYKIYINDEYVETVTSTNYTASNLENGDYTFGVAAVYPEGTSEIVEVGPVSVSTNPLDPVTNLEYDYTSGHNYVDLSWVAPNNPNPNPVVGLEEGFESGVFPPEGWTVADVDGDGDTWAQGSPGNTTAHNGEGAAISASWAGYPLTPDNYLITPAVEIQAGMELSWWVAGQDPNYSQEHYAVYVGDSADPASFSTVLFEETIPANPSGTIEYLNHVVGLDDYAGQTVYFAFRHFNVTDMFRVNIDDVVVGSSKRVAKYNSRLSSPVVSSGETRATAVVSKFERANNKPSIVTTPFASKDVTGYKIYINDEYVETVTSTNYTASNLTYNEDYMFGVAAVYPEGDSPIVEVGPVHIEPGNELPMWVEYGENYSFEDAVGVTSPWKSAIDFDFGTVNSDKVYVNEIQTGLLNPENGVTWKVVEFANGMPTENVIGDLMGTFNTSGGEMVSTPVMSEENIQSSHVAFVIESQGNYMARDPQNNNSQGNWAYIDSWIHLDEAGFPGSWAIRAYVSKTPSGDVQEIVPGTTTLAQNYPNPFNPTTTINFFNNMSGKVELSVYNAKGELVSTLINSESFATGNHSIKFDASNLNSGVYFYTLKTPTKTISKKMVLVK